MKIVYRKTPKRLSTMTQRNVQSIAKTLSCTNRRAFVITKADPFSYIELLREYGIFAKAKPVIRSRKLVGYNFAAI